MTESAQDRRVKTALDETRLLILGAQILFGFHLNSAFQNAFAELSSSSRALHATSFLLMAAAVALLIAPSLQHQIVEGGRATPRIVTATARLAAAALLPFALSLGIDLYILFGLRFGPAIGVVVGCTFSILALFGWYGAEWLLARLWNVEAPMQKSSDTPVEVRVEQMLTEARVLLPGAQALLGFQLSILLTDGFTRLPQSSKIVHSAALMSMALTVILLMAPAAFHRITFHGASTERMHRLGSTLLLTAAVPLALGIVLEMYVAVTKALETPALGIAVAVAAAVVLIGLWLLLPLSIRARERRQGGA